MTDLPDVKLRALVNFPVRVTGRTAIAIEKVEGQYYLDLDVSDLVQNDNISAEEVDQSRMIIWNSTTDAFETVPYALAATSGVSSIDGQTGALDIGAGLTMTGDTLEVDAGDGLTFTGDTLELADFTQTGTGAVPISLASTFQDKIYTPEMFGAAAVPLGTAYASVPDSTAELQACIDALADIGGGTMLLGPGAYGFETLTISTGNIYIQGSGRNATTLVHIVTAPSTGLNFTASGPVLNNVGVSDLTVGSGNTTFTKVAIAMINASSPTIRNIDVGHYPWDGTLYRGTLGSGIGLSVQGLELGLVDNFFCYAELPLHISVACDSWTFKDFVGYAGTSTTNSVITVATGTSITNVTFCGHQNWIGGLDGFHWVDTTAVSISEGLYLIGIKSEQAGDQAGYIVNIQHNNAFYGLHIGDGIGGDRNGIYLRKVQHSVITNFFYDANSNPNKIGLNLDSTDSFCQIIGCTWVPGTLLTMSGLTLVQSSGIVTGYSTAIPSSGVYTVTGSGLATINGAAIVSGANAPTFSADKGTLYLRTDGSSSSTRAYINTDGSTGWTSVTTAT